LNISRKENYQMYYLLNAESLAAALGGDVVGPNQVKAPGPNHSPKDRSLSVKMEPSAPGGLLIYSFADDSYEICLDYVYSKLGIGRDGANFVSSPVAPTNARAMASWS
jgi:hypothetical protein